VKARRKRRYLKEGYLQEEVDSLKMMVLFQSGRIFAETVLKPMKMGSNVTDKLSIEFAKIVKSISQIECNMIINVMAVTSSSVISIGSVKIQTIMK
jgi:hypothetical protein